MRDTGNQHMLVQVYEICPRCEYLFIPHREYTMREVEASRPCPAGCGERLDVVVLRGRRVETPQDQLTADFHDVLLGAQWAPSPEELYVVLRISEWDDLADGS